MNRKLVVSLLFIWSFGAIYFMFKTSSNEIPKHVNSHKMKSEDVNRKPNKMCIISMIVTPSEEQKVLSTNL